MAWGQGNFARADGGHKVLGIERDLGRMHFYGQVAGLRGSETTVEVVP